MMEYGLVSVIMPCYNAADYIGETIESVLAQTYENWELLIVDDGSTDDSLSVIARYNDPRIRVLKTAENSGAAVARNVAIEAAHGRFMAFLDSDDLWHPEKLSEQLTFMQEHGCALSFTHYYFDRDGELSEFAPSSDTYDYKTILKHNYMACPTVIYDTERVGKVYMPTDAIKREDVGCWLCILRTGEVAHCLHKCLTTVKIHAGSVSFKKTQMIKYQWHLYRRVEHLSLLRSAYCMTHWAIKGFLKYR